MARMTRGFYALRWEVFERDNYTCQYCGQCAPNVKLEVDHVIPVADGGSNDMDNLRTSCYACNRGKAGLQVQRTHRQKLSPRGTKARIIQVLRNGPMTTNEIIEALGITLNNANVSLHRLRKTGTIVQLNTTKAWELAA